MSSPTFPCAVVVVAVGALLVVVNVPPTAALVVGAVAVAVAVGAARLVGPLALTVPPRKVRR